MPTSNQVDDKKVAKVISKLFKTINRAKLSIPELLVLYGNLGYHLGASMAGCRDNGPSIQDLKRAYYENPTVDTGLMIQGLMITDWEHDFLKSPKLSQLAKENQK